MREIDDIDIRRLDGGLLLAFQALLQYRNATKVAAQLNLSQSAISHALARLRTVFDDPLFIRRPHGLEPTRRALELGPQVDAVIDGVATLMGGAQRFDPKQSKRLFRISAPEFVAVLIGARLINQFHAVAPGASYWMSHLSEQPAFDALRRGEIDIAIGRYPSLPPTATGLISEPLFEDRYCVVARRDHPRLNGAISVVEYHDAAHVFASAQSEVAAEETKLDYSHLEISAIVPYWLTALTLASTSDAIATCPRRLAGRLADTLALQVMAAPFESTPMTISTVRRADDGDASKDWLLDQLRQSIEID